MVGSEVFMDVPKVRQMGKRFEVIGKAVAQVSNALQAMLTILKATAFVGLFGNTMMAQYLESMKPKIDKFAVDCTELGGDLLSAAHAYQNGDAVGSTRFH